MNVPNATLMIIENAERFGLSQLHQLRGRVGRGSAASCCVLVSGSKPESRAGKRLAVMKNTFDGFRIAEYDLGERGPGDFHRRRRKQRRDSTESCGSGLRICVRIWRFSRRRKKPRKRTERKPCRMLSRPTPDDFIQRKLVWYYISFLFFNFRNDIIVSL